MDLLHAVLLACVAFQTGFLTCLFFGLVTAVIFLTETRPSSSRVVTARPVAETRPNSSTVVTARPVINPATDIITKLLHRLDRDWSYSYTDMIQFTGSVYLAHKWKRHLTGMKISLRKVRDILE